VSIYVLSTKLSRIIPIIFNYISVKKRHIIIRST